MTRIRNLPLAIAALAVSAGAALGFSALPSAAGPGLDTATEAAGRTVPARPATIGAPQADPAAAPLDVSALPDAAELPDAASHGAAVSAVATADDPTPDTNKGADVSAVARDNHGLAESDVHRPDAAGKPDGAGQPDEPGRP